MNRMSLSYRRILFVMVLMVIVHGVSCDRNRVYEQIHTVDPEGWSQHDFLRFEFGIPDTTIPHHFFINLRNSVDYPYANLFLFVRTILPNGEKATDTLDIQLSDPDGRWLGKGVGKFRDVKVLVIPSFRFPMEGNYVFEIENAMRDEPHLTGIAAVGIRLERMEK